MNIKIPHVDIENFCKSSRYKDKPASAALKTASTEFML